MPGVLLFQGVQFKLKAQILCAIPAFSLWLDTVA